MQLDSKRVYYKTAQGKVRHGIYDAIAGTVGGKAKPNPRGIYATLKEATANKHMPKGETDVDEDEVRTGGGGVKSDEESDDEGGPDIDNSFYWTAEDDTWTDVMLHFGIEDDERQKLYFKWLKDEWKMGNKPEFRSDPGATHFFNPIKNKRKLNRSLHHRSVQATGCMGGHRATRAGGGWRAAPKDVLHGRKGGDASAWLRAQ